MDAISQTPFSNAFSERKLLYFNRLSRNFYPQGCNYPNASIDPDNCLTPNRWQVIICTKDGLVNWRIYALLGLNEFLNDIVFSSGIIKIGNMAYFELTKDSSDWWVSKYLRKILKPPRSSWWFLLLPDNSSLRTIVSDIYYSPIYKIEKCHIPFRYHPQQMKYHEGPDPVLVGNVCCNSQTVPCLLVAILGVVLFLECPTLPAGKILFKIPYMF